MDDKETLTGKDRRGQDRRGTSQPEDAGTPVGQASGQRHVQHQRPREGFLDAQQAVEYLVDRVKHADAAIGHGRGAEPQLFVPQGNPAFGQFSGVEVVKRQVGRCDPGCRGLSTGEQNRPEPGGHNDGQQAQRSGTVRNSHQRWASLSTVRCSLQMIDFTASGEK